MSEEDAMRSTGNWDEKQSDNKMLVLMPLFQGGEFKQSEERGRGCSCGQGRLALWKRQASVIERRRACIHTSEGDGCSLSSALPKEAYLKLADLAGCLWGLQNCPGDSCHRFSA